MQDFMKDRYGVDDLSCALGALGVNIDENHLGEQPALHEGERRGRPDEPATDDGDFAIVNHRKPLSLSRAQTAPDAIATDYHQISNISYAEMPSMRRTLRKHRNARRGAPHQRMPAASIAATAARRPSGGSTSAMRT